MRSNQYGSVVRPGVVYTGNPPPFILTPNQDRILAAEQAALRDLGIAAIDPLPIADMAGPECPIAPDCEIDLEIDGNYVTMTISRSDDNA